MIVSKISLFKACKSCVVGSIFSSLLVLQCSRLQSYSVSLNSNILLCLSSTQSVESVLLSLTHNTCIVAVFQLLHCSFAVLTLFILHCMHGMEHDIFHDVGTHAPPYFFFL
uniref:Uncharacterized protein n=1 Tax=Cacopsylla melanoneura TaxID=428564 RepID=A0A8D8W8M8_9HEMI